MAHGERTLTDEGTIEYWVEDSEGEQVDGTYKEIPFKVFYNIHGDYRAATRWEPAESPEVEIVNIIWTNPVTGVEEDADSEIVFSGVIV